jgi:hypothetical protein
MDTENNTMKALIVKLKQQFPHLEFVPGSRFAWSPGKSQVMYKDRADTSDGVAIWSLLHEVGHALLKHQSYQSDFELLSLEVEAWQKAGKLAKTHGYQINQDHIEDCLDTYRDWLYQRSTCPSCTSCSLQVDGQTYCCFNCGTTWHVSASRLCRPYRRLKQKETLV